MAYPGAPKDGKSDVDRPFLPERQGQAKQAFEKADKATEKSVTAERPTGNQGKLPNSINRNAPGMDHDMRGGGGVKAANERAVLSQEHAAAKKQQAIEKASAKKMAKSNGIDQNKSKSQDKGRE